MSFFSMKIRDVMTPDVECVTPAASLREAAEIMRRLDVGIVPVCVGPRIEGVITDRDIAIRGVAEGRDPMTTPVRGLMTREVVCCYADNSIEEAAQMMREKQIRRLMILDSDDRLVGIVSLGDLAIDTGDKKMVGDVLQHVSEPVLSQ